MFLLVDNYDSFTYNLVHAFENQGVSPQVVRNDDESLLSLAGLPELEGVCISPGPSNPGNAGLCLQFLDRLPKNVPVLGVCLGHQAIGHVYGGKVIRAGRLMHGKTSPIQHTGKGVLKDMPKPFDAIRYHSLLVERASLPAELEITAWAADNETEIMGLQHKTLPVYGVQFHPESILTQDGMRILKNFLEL